MYLKIAMYRGSFRILEQDTRARMENTATNGIKIMILQCPEMRGYSRTLFLRGTEEEIDNKLLEYDMCREDFTNYLRALEEVVERFVVCLRYGNL